MPAKFDLDLTIFVPCLNEEKNICDTLDTIAKSLVENMAVEVLVVDDGSTDCTSLEVEKYKAKKPNFELILLKREKNYGLGSAFFYAVEHAQGKHFMLIPGDNVKPVEHISTIIKSIGKADLIIPFFGRGDNRNLGRRFVSKSFTTVVNILSGHKINYYNGAIVHRTEILSQIPFRTSGFGYQAEIVCWEIKKFNLSTFHVQVPILEKVVGSGNAFKLKNIISVLKSLLNIFLRRLF